MLTDQQLPPLRRFFSLLSTHDISVLRQLVKYVYNSFKKHYRQALRRALGFVFSRKDKQASY